MGFWLEMTGFSVVLARTAHSSLQIWIVQFKKDNLNSWTELYNFDKNRDFNFG